MLLENNLYKNLYEGKCEERIIMNYDIINFITMEQLGEESFASFLKLKYVILKN